MYLDGGNAAPVTHRPDDLPDKDQTLASMQRIADFLSKEQAKLWINHDKVQTDQLKRSPEFYD